MMLVQILLVVILAPVALHLMRILVVTSPGHSRALTPVVTGTSTVAIIILLAVLGGTLASGQFEPLDLPQRTDLQSDAYRLEHSIFRQD